MKTFLVAVACLFIGAAGMDLWNSAQPKVIPKAPVLSSLYPSTIPRYAIGAKGNLTLWVDEGKLWLMIPDGTSSTKLSSGEALSLTKTLIAVMRSTWKMEEM